MSREAIAPGLFARVAGPLPEPYLLVVAEGAGIVAAANPAAAALLGLPPGAFGSLPLHALVADPPEGVAAFLRRCAGTGSLVPGQLSVRVRGGEVIRYRAEGAALAPAGPGAPAQVLLRLRPHEDASRRFLLLNQQIDALSHEVHERRRAERALQEQAVQLEELAAELEQTIEELRRQTEEANEARNAAEEANRAKSDFLATMSHELRTPLNAIIGYADLLDAEVRGPLNPDQKAQVGRVRRSAAHLLQLIEEILTFARIEAGREVVRLEPLLPAEVAREAVEALEPAAAERGIELRLELPAAPVHALADAARLRQVLLNLLSNAIKFTDGGSVAVRVEAADAWVRLRVRDTGVGIAPEDLQRIFEPFTQLDASRTRRRGGTGLGLTVSRELARLMEGELEVESRPGAGSEFTLRLPAHRP